VRSSFGSGISSGSEEMRELCSENGVVDLMTDIRFMEALIAAELLMVRRW
jgi:hypothetical protein